MSTSFSPRSCLIYAATVIFITLAVCFSLLRAALPHAHGHVAQLETTLSQQTGLVIEIDSLDAEMSWFTPRLILIGIGVSEEQGSAEMLSFDRIELSLSYLDSIRFASLRVAEINLVLNELQVERLAEGRWKLQGFELNTEGDQGLPDDLRSVLENTAFSVTGKKVAFTDHTGSLEAAELEDVDISVSHFLGEHTVAARIPLPAEYGDVLTVSARYRGEIESILQNDTELYLSVTQADLGRWSDRLQIDTDVNLSGQADLELWLAMVAERPRSIAVAIEEASVRLSDDEGDSWQADDLETTMHWHSEGDSWSLRVRDLNYRQEGDDWPEPVDIDVGMNREVISVQANYLAFRDVRTLMGLIPVDADDERFDVLLSVTPETELYNLAAEIDRMEPARSSLAFTAQDLGYRHQGDSVEGLDLRARYADGEGVLDIVASDVTLKTHTMFRETIELDRLDASIDIRAVGSAWHLDTPLLAFSNADMNSSSRFAASWSEQEGLFLDMRSHIDSLSGAAVSRYLPVSALNDGLIEWLDIAITDGRIDQGYFRFYGNAGDYPFDNDGKMLAGFMTEDLNLKFNPDWPALGKLAADVQFDNRSMFIRGLDARQYGARLESLTARIDDLSDSVLVLDGTLRTPVKDIQRYIWSSPLDAKLGAAMNQLQTDGSAQTSIALRIPLGDDDALELDGSIDFDGSTIAYPGLGYTLKDVNGTLRFDDRTVQSEDMSARLGRNSVRILADSGDDDNGRYTGISFEGEMAADTLLAKFDWMPEHWVSGSSPWDITLTIPHYDTDHDVRVVADSTLRGTSVSFSDVVSKPSADDYPLQISALVSGDVVSIESALPAGQTVNASRDPEGNWQTVIDTAHLAGRVGFHESMATDTVIDLDLDRIDLGSLFERADSSGEASTLLPDSIPSLRIDARDVVWQSWSFERAVINTASNQHGMLISDIALNARDLEITGQGTWLTSWRSPHETSLSLTTRSGNFGSALTALGYGQVIEDGSQTAQLSLNWPAEPYGFSWQQLSGSAEVELKKGIVADIDTGAGGKLVGLLNVFHLPRRLLLDFSDLKDGLAFDTIRSKLVFADGYASTDDTDIFASVADMRVTGDVDMHNRNYDLVVRVKPNQTAATFTGGAIAGGAVVGAGLVLLQKLLNIDKATQDRYSITGSWDEPVVTRIEKASSDDSSDEEDDADDYQ